MATYHQGISMDQHSYPHVDSTYLEMGTFVRLLSHAENIYFVIGSSTSTCCQSCVDLLDSYRKIL
jgi:hypothetical protein